ncbi:MAG: hypothetical protein KGJ54_14845 [Betaproteobacteria bacterium]|nr:hypothetical protein [Betaproteobacteria bacterium]
MAVSYRVIATRICRPENDKVSTQVVIAGWCRSGIEKFIQIIELKIYIVTVPAFVTGNVTENIPARASLPE